MSTNNETKIGVSVSEMARMVGLSRQRFHQLMQGGVFPQPQRDNGRPFYDKPTQEMCLEVRRRNCGVNGQVVLFYARRQAAPTAPRKMKPTPSPHADLLDGLRSLGLASVTAADVGAVVEELYPQGTAGFDEGEVLRAVFLHLKKKPLMLNRLPFLHPRRCLFLLLAFLSVCSFIHVGPLSAASLLWGRTSVERIAYVGIPGSVGMKVRDKWLNAFISSKDQGTSKRCSA